MRRINLTLAVALTMIPLAGFAQQAPGAVEGSSPGGTVGVTTATRPNGDVVPQQGGPLHPGTQTGLDKVAEDGVSTKTVKAVPCSIAARETDGTTTCVGIPDSAARKR